MQPETIPIARSAVPFALVGGTDTACRWKGPADNSDSYFVMIEVTRFDHLACQAACAQAYDTCLGYEYRAYTGRCELWNRKPEVSVGAIGYECYERLPLDAHSFTLPVRYNATIRSFIIGYVMDVSFTNMCGFNMDAAVDPGVGNIDITVSAYSEDVFDPAGFVPYVQGGCMRPGEDHQMVVAMFPIEFQHNFSTMWPWVIARDFYRVTAGEQYSAFCSGKMSNCTDPDRTEKSMPYRVWNVTHNRAITRPQDENSTYGTECTHDENCTIGCTAELAELDGCVEDIGFFCRTTVENRTWRDLVVVAGKTVVNGTHWEDLAESHCTQVRPAENQSHCEEQPTGWTFEAAVESQCRCVNALSSTPGGLIILNSIALNHSVRDAATTPAGW